MLSKEHLEVECAAKHNPLCAVNRSVRGWWIAESGAFRAEEN